MGCCRGRPRLPQGHLLNRTGGAGRAPTARPSFLPQPTRLLVPPKGPGPALQLAMPASWSAAPICSLWTAAQHDQLSETWGASMPLSRNLDG
jgi:hypothetical protein